MDCLNAPTIFREYTPGSIVKIKLQDFLTYEFVEFECGPRLNFVLGPNGSGKSSLVCAICLGLAGSPKTLFRAEKLHGFVRHGQQKAVVEIVLKGPEIGELIAIRRIITVEDTSEWKINAKKATLAKVREIIDSLKIQVDNLCNFLPQERVHAFAQLTPNMRFRETMRTIGGRDMVETYERLVEFRSEEKETKRTIDAVNGELQHLRQQNDSVAADVERFQERESIEARILNIERKKPWIEYNNARDDWQVAKAERKAKKEQLKMMELEYQPLVNDIENLQNIIANSIKDRKSELVKRNERVERVDEARMDVAKHNLAIDSARKSVIGYHDFMKKRREELQKLQTSLVSTNKILSGGKPELTAELKEQAVAAAKEARRARELLDQSVARKENIEQSARQKQMELSRIDQELKQFSDVHEAKLQSLRSRRDHVFRAYEWLKTNQHHFQYPIKGPVVMDISVRDERYAVAIENLINQDVMFAFVARTKADYDQFLRLCSDQQGLRVSAVALDGPRHTHEGYDHPLSREQLRGVGFDCWALEQVIGSDECLTALCEFASLHEIPISLKGVNDEQAYRAGISVYISNGNRCNWKTSRYGARNASMRANRIRNMATLTADSGNEDRKMELEAKRNDIMNEIRTASNECRRIEAEVAQINESSKAAEEEKRRIAGLRQDICDLQKAYDKAQARKPELETKIHDIRQRLAGNEELEGLKRKVQDACSDKAKHVARYLQRVREVARLSSTTAVAFEIEQLQEKKNRLEDEYKEKTLLLDQARLELKAVSETVTAIYSKAQVLLKKAQESGDLTDDLDVLPDTLDELEDLLRAEKAKLDLAEDTDPTLVKLFKKRQEEISSKESVLSSLSAKLDSLRVANEGSRLQWEGSVNDAIADVAEKFSNNFAYINCNGEVKINRGPPGEEDNYANWGIDILVKFRDDEPLSALTAHRQSGGERSVSIISYLMALQDLSNSPFRVVDEINQGMDRRNERLIHSRIVETVCETSGSSGGAGKQYFLITPKLLCDLRYHESMRILVVYNGMWLPEEQDAWQSARGEKWAVSNQPDMAEVTTN